MILDEKDLYRMKNLTERYEREYPGQRSGYRGLATWIYANCGTEVVFLLEQMLTQGASQGKTPSTDR